MGIVVGVYEGVIVGPILVGIVVSRPDGLMEKVVLGNADGFKAIGGLCLEVGLKVGDGIFVGLIVGVLVGRRRWTFPLPIP